MQGPSTAIAVAARTPVYALHELATASFAFNAVAVQSPCCWAVTREQGIARQLEEGTRVWIMSNALNGGDRLIEALQAQQRPSSEQPATLC